MSTGSPAGTGAGADERPAPVPPAAVLAAVGDARWEPTEPTNPEGGSVWWVAAHHVKFVPAGSLEPSATDEADRLIWLADRAPVPEVVATASDQTGSWLVTRTAAGTPAHRGELHADVGAVVHAVATGLRRLHDLPVADCPFDAGWDRLDADVARSLAAGRIEPASLDAPFDRYDAARLVELWRQGRPDRPEDRVVLHGDPSLPNLLVDGSALVGLVDVGRLGVGDRHLDLAVVHLSLHRNLGPNAVFAFYDAYGLDPDLVRLEHYRLGTILR